MIDDSSSSSGRRPRGRSPAYPAISLEKAVQRARLLWNRDKQYPIPVASVATVWGYAALNGPAALQVSALKKFGLVDDEGSRDERTVKVTDLAVKILNHPASEARAEAIREAAMLPGIHREMWDKYGSRLPSDANLEWSLARERGFTETGAKEFIREYRETLEYAGLDESTSSLDEVESNAEDVAAGTEASPSAFVGLETDDFIEENRAANTRHELLQRARRDSGLSQTYQIPVALSGKPPVQVTGVFPLSEAEWTQFFAVLEAMKPVLVGEQQADDPTSETADK